MDEKFIFKKRGYEQDKIYKNIHEKVDEIVNVLSLKKENK